MAQWKPPSDAPVGPNEPVGRRLFDQPMLVGMRDLNRGAQRLDVRHFLEPRHRELSLDRLGRTGIDKAVVRYLCPIAVIAGQTFSPPKAFNGWAVIRAKQLEAPPRGNMHLPVIASPVLDTDGNIYHAHAVLPDSLDAWVTACFLRDLFETRGSIESAGKAQQQRFGILEFMLSRLSESLLRAAGFVESLLRRDRSD